MRINSTDLLALTQKHIIRRKQFILYSCIGVSGVIIDYIAYALGIGVVGLGILTANFISVSLGIINNFFWNVKYNFKVTDNIAVRFTMFYSVGFMGLILSDILLVIFHQLLHVGPLPAKLLTLPFVLVTQYLVNKYISFGSVEKMRGIARKYSFHWPAYVLIFMFLCCSLMFVKYIPANFSSFSPAYAPDEKAHYSFNVQYILDNHRLPVSGRDDLDAYKNCRDNITGQVPCVYSYVFYPGPNYVMSALSSSILTKLTSVSPEIAARAPSTIYGCIFVLSTYLAVYLLTRRRLISTLITFATAFIPQYIFVTSYTNLDAHSVAISGILGLATVIYSLYPHNRWSIPLLGIAAGGLLPVTKYNYFILIFPVIVLTIIAIRRHAIGRNQIVRLMAWTLGSFMVLAAFWYIRNLVLYHDPLGQSYALKEMTKFHPLGHALPSNLSTLIFMIRYNFFEVLYNSFYVAYGQMAYYLQAYQYVVPQILSAVSAVLILFTYADRGKPKRILYATLGFITTFLLALAQVFYNSYKNDFQPQGRYMFPILIVSAIYLAYLYRVDKRYGLISILAASGTLFVFICGMELFVKVYL